MATATFQMPGGKIEYDLWHIDQNVGGAIRAGGSSRPHDNEPARD